MFESLVQRYASRVTQPPLWLSYLVAFAFSGLGLLATLWLRTFSPTAPTLFYVFVSCSALFGGFGPGLTSALLCCLFYFFKVMAPERGGVAFENLADVLQLAAFAFMSVVTAFLSALMREAQRWSLEAAQKKEEFLAKISHELRTPLNAVIGASELLSRTALTRDQASQVEILGVSSRNLLRLIDDILDMAKYTSGVLDIEAQPFKVREELNQVLDIVRMQIDPARVRVYADISTEIPQLVWGDPLRLRQVVVNLLGNSVKFTEEGQITLHARPADELGHILFEVRDTGIGITKEKLDVIFEPFAQGDNSSARQHSGAGLGLSIAKRIVEQLGGSIGVKSSPGKGSTFFFKISLPETSGEALVSSAYRTAASASSRTILLVEDNPLNQEVLARLIEHLGHRIVVASSGLEALSLIEKEPIDLVLLDCHLPGMSGIEVARRLRSSFPDSKALPIIALTADVSEKNHRECFEAGMNDFLMKPIRLASLEKTLSQWFETVSLNRTYLSQLRGVSSQEGWIEELANLYSELTPKRLSSLKEAVSKRDWRAAHHFAHSIRSASSTLGAERMAMLCQKIEELLQDGEIHGEVIALEEEWVRVRHELDALRCSAIAH